MSLLVMRHSVLKMLLRDIPTYLVGLLAHVMQRAYHLKILSEPLPAGKVRTTPVFDLVNCGPNHRFRLSTGLVAHNCLGFGYNMGAAKFVKTAYEQGHIISLKDARELHRNYWQLFAGVKRFADRLAAQVERDGYIVNSFGYRGKPPPHKAFNFFIQSTVSGIMHVLLAHVANVAPYMELVTIIHDECIFSVPTERLEEFRRDMKTATQLLNDSLKWSVQIRVGFAAGQTLYDAK